MKIRRHLPDSIEWERWLAPLAPRKERLLLVYILAGSLLIGYAGAALVLFPAPFFVSEQGVPRLFGMDTLAAQQAVTTARLKIRSIESAPHPTAARGTVTWQDPPPAVLLPEGSDVDLQISAGPQRIQVPDVERYDTATARMLITAAGLRVGRIENQPTNLPAGVVVRTRPDAGATLSPNTAVELVVSAGAATITVPSVIGMTLNDARTALEQAGLRLGEHRTRSADAPAMTVVEQEPGAGTLSAPGAAIRVTLSRRGG